jgi:hypothetical protein
MGAKEMMPRKVYREEVALAMELRTWGATWRVIGHGLGMNPDTIRRAVREAKAKGYKGFPAYSETVFNKP